MSDHLRAVHGELRWQPVPQRIRVTLAGTTVADTLGAVLVWQPRRGVPSYAVPEADLTADLTLCPPTPLPKVLPPFLSTPHFDWHTTPGQPLSVRAGGETRDNVAFRPADPDLAGYVVLDFAAFGWREEDVEVIGHPHDPFKRIDVLPSSRHVVVALDGVELASSHSPVALLETQLPVRWYLPRGDLHEGRLEPSATHTVCAYKGIASYLSVVGGGDAGRDLAWTYPDPLHDATGVRGLVAFFSERCDISVDGVPMRRRVTPWSTPEEQARGLDFD